MPDSSPDADVSTSDVQDSTVNSQTDTNANQDSNGPDSSTAKPAGSMLDAVQAALAPKAESPPAPNPDEAAKGQSDVEKADGEAEGDAELSEAELKALSWKAQQRFKKLASAAKTKDGEIAELKVKATEHDKMVGAIAKAGLEPSDVDELVALGSLLKHGDPAKGLEKLYPLVRALEGMAGKVLPADLQEKVRLGYIDEASARELAETRAKAKFTEQSQQRQQQANEAEQQERERRELIDSTTQAIETWDKQQAAADPDWHLKRQEVSEQVELLIVREQQKRKEPYFPNREEAVEIAKTALKKVNERIARLKPRPTDIRPPVAPGGSPRSKPAANTILDAINNAL